MDDKTYILKISGEKFTHEQEIDSVQKAKIISFLMLPESNLSAQQQPPQSSIAQSNEPEELPAPSSTSYLSPSEYLIQKKPSTIAQKIAVFGMWLKLFKQQDGFTKDDIRMVFEEAREPLQMRNYTRDFDTAIRNGFLLKRSDGLYAISNTGESAVSDDFVHSSKKGAHKRGNGKKKGTLKIREEVEKLDLVPDTKPYQYYWKLNKGDRVLWLLAQANERGIKDLNYKEISRLAEKIGDAIDSKQVTSLVKTHIKTQKVYPLLQNDVKVLRIVPPGIEDVKEKKGEAAQRQSAPS